VIIGKKMNARIRQSPVIKGRENKDPTPVIVTYQRPTAKGRFADNIRGVEHVVRSIPYYFAERGNSFLIRVIRAKEFTILTGPQRGKRPRAGKIVINPVEISRL